MICIFKSIHYYYVKLKYYNYVKLKYAKKAKLCYMDKEKFIVYIKIDDIYKDFWNYDFFKILKFIKILK